MPSDEDKVTDLKTKKTIKSCHTCGIIIEDSSLLRCPRCNASLIKLGCNGACGKCVKNNNCS